MWIRWTDRYSDLRSVHGAEKELSWCELPSLAHRNEGPGLTDQVGDKDASTTFPSESHVCDGVGSWESGREGVSQSQIASLKHWAPLCWHEGTRKILEAGEIR